jgi:hypothetical protein
MTSHNATRTSLHGHCCNCGSTDVTCYGQTATTFTITVEPSARELLKLPIVREFYWPPAVESAYLPRPLLDRPGRRTWREWARVRRHARHDRRKAIDKRNPPH